MTSLDQTGYIEASQAPSMHVSSKRRVNVVIPAAKTGALLCVLLVLIGCTRQAPEHPIVVGDGNAVRIPLKEVDDGGVHFYTYKYEGKNINFLVRTDGKGQLRTHFDACYSCFKYKMGYRVEGPDILCIACGLKYNLAEAHWEFIGPCAPINLKSAVKGDFLVIDVSRLEKGKRLF